MRAGGDNREGKVALKTGAVCVDVRDIVFNDRMLGITRPISLQDLCICWSIADRRFQDFIN